MGVPVLAVLPSPTASAVGDARQFKVDRPEASIYVPVLAPFRLRYPETSSYTVLFTAPQILNLYRCGCTSSFAFDSYPSYPLLSVHNSSLSLLASSTASSTSLARSFEKLLIPSTDIGDSSADSNKKRVASPFVSYTICTV